jgi:hypothetical protein
MVTDVEEPEASWVALLPKALRFLHDVPGESGLSPYEVVFGRHRPLQGLPHQPPREAEGALAFMERMRKLDITVAQKLNELHEKRWAQINSKRREPPPFERGSKVWYKPEPQPGRDKLDPRWKRGVVAERVGRDSYVVELAPGLRREAHRSQLKPHVDDEYNTSPLPLFYFSGKATPVQVGPDEWTVESIEGHRINKGTGQHEFLVRWKDWDPTDLQWQPWQKFFQLCNEEVLDFCTRNNIALNLVEWHKKKEKGRP